MILSKAESKEGGDQEDNKQRRDYSEIFIQATCKAIAVGWNAINWFLTFVTGQESEDDLGTGKQVRSKVRKETQFSRSCEEILVLYYRSVSPVSFSRHIFNQSPSKAKPTVTSHRNGWNNAILLSADISFLFFRAKGERNSALGWKAFLSESSDYLSERRL